MQLEERPHRAPFISLTPLIDVVFILLVFFMLATRFGQFREQPVDIRTTGPQSSEEQQEWSIVTVLADGRIRWNEQTYTLADGVQQVKQTAQPVWLRAEGGATLQQTLNALDVFRRQGVEAVQLELLP